MKANWAVTVVFVGAIVVAGLFAQGMTRVSGLVPTQAQLNAQVARQPNLMPVRNAASVHDTAAASVPRVAMTIAGAEEKPEAKSEDKPEATAPEKPADAEGRSEAAPATADVAVTPLPDSVPGTAQANDVATSTVMAPTVAAQASGAPAASVANKVAAAPATKTNPPAKRPAPPRVDEAEAASPALSAAQRRQAQCKALAGWVQQLETIAAERRSELGYQEWTRTQRDQARERQAELGCARLPA